MVRGGHPKSVWSLYLMASSKWWREDELSIHRPAPAGKNGKFNVFLPPSFITCSSLIISTAFPAHGRVRRQAAARSVGRAEARHHRRRPRWDPRQSLQTHPHHAHLGQQQHVQQRNLVLVTPLKVNCRQARPTPIVMYVKKCDVRPGSQVLVKWMEN